MEYKLRLHINIDECQSNAKNISKSQNIHRMIHVCEVKKREKLKNVMFGDT